MDVALCFPALVKLLPDAGRVPAGLHLSWELPCLRSPQLHHGALEAVSDLLWPVGSFHVVGKPPTAELCAQAAPCTSRTLHPSPGLGGMHVE